MNESKVQLGNREANSWSERVTRLAARVVVVTMVSFATWTLLHYAATFGGIPWKIQGWIAALLALPTLLGGILLSNRWAALLVADISPGGTPVTQPSPRILFLWLLVAVALLVLPVGYPIRFGLTVLGLAALWAFGSKGPVGSTSVPVAPLVGRDNWTVWAISGSIALAVTTMLCAHRPDLDDSSFLQIVAQTLAQPDKAPLTFDTALGLVTETFRFQPYRLASYETWIAWIVSWSGLDLFSVYYLILPSIVAVLSVLAALVFARLFLAAPVAVAAASLWVLLLLAWGETHVAYGNRVFVRLFQGKGLLVALTTPFSVAAGLLLVRHRSTVTGLVFALSLVAALGVSSSGLMCALCVAVLTGCVAMGNGLRQAWRSLGWLSGAVLIPVVLGIWLKWVASGPVGLQEIGTYLPINASLGSGYREPLALVLLILGGWALSGPARRDYLWLTAAILLVVFNPWLADGLSGLSARNMSWRLAWAAPVPVLMAVSAAAGIFRVAVPPDVRQRTSLRSWAAGGVVLAFLVAGRWTIAESNNVQWRSPSPKLTDEFYALRPLAAHLSENPVQGTTLAVRSVAAWLPFLAPGVPVIMPGHTYPEMYRTSLPAAEFGERMRLVELVNGNYSQIKEEQALLQKYQVRRLIVTAESAPAISQALENAGISYQSPLPVAGFVLIDLW